MALFRIEPNMPVGAYTTYALSMPKETHLRPATCAEVRCPAWENGWKTVVPSVGLQADFIRSKQHGRHFVEQPAGAGLAEFVFPAGQSCFRSSEHRTTLHREPFASLRGGDWRGATTPTKRVGLPEWVDRFATNQSAIADKIQEG